MNKSIILLTGDMSSIADISARWTVTMICVKRKEMSEYLTDRKRVSRVSLGCTALGENEV